VSRQRLARFGEDVAARFLQARGAAVVGRNVRVGRGEIDLVVRMHGRRVAVEVKTVGPGRSGEPVDQYDRPKAATVQRLAHRLRPPATRVDFVGVRVVDGGVRVRWLPGVD